MVPRLRVSDRPSGKDFISYVSFGSGSRCWSAPPFDGPRWTTPGPLQPLLLQPCRGQVLACSVAVWLPVNVSGLAAVACRVGPVGGC